MVTENIAKYIKELGVPVLFALLMFWQANTTIAKQSESIDGFKEVVVELNHSVDSNTKAIESLTNETTSIKNIIDRQENGR